MVRSKKGHIISVLIGILIGLGVGYLCSEIYTSYVASRAISDEQITTAAMISIFSIFPFFILSCVFVSNLLYRKILTNKDRS